MTKAVRQTSGARTARASLSAARATCYLLS